MATNLPRTGERMNPQDFERSKVAYLSYLRHLFAYETAKSRIPPHRRVLEIGCGEGYGTHYLSNSVDEIIGLDIDEQVIAHASEQYGAERCRFQRFDGERLPYPDAAFPVILSFQVIEHIEHDRAFLQEIRRVLHPQGWCMLATPNGTQRVLPGKRPWNRFHVREYTPDEFRTVLQSVFSDVKTWGLRGSGDIESIEKARIKQAQRFAAFDLFQMRKYLPPSLESVLLAARKYLFDKIRPAQESDDFLDAYNLHSYRLVEDDLENSLDLFAVCGLINLAKVSEPSQG